MKNSGNGRPVFKLDAYVGTNRKHAEEDWEYRRMCARHALVAQMWWDWMNRTGDPVRER